MAHSCQVVGVDRWLVPPSVQAAPVGSSPDEREALAFHWPRTGGSGRSDRRGRSQPQVHRARCQAAPSLDHEDALMGDAWIAT